MEKPAPASAGKQPPSTSTAALGGISFFEKWLTVWVALCMIGGALLGIYIPALTDAISKVTFYDINGLVAVLLWLMLFPMLVQIDMRSICAVKKAPGAILLTSSMNYLVKPFSMFGLALLFMRVVYVDVIPSAEVRDSYIAGLVLLAGAPCTAMVFVWSSIMGGDGAYTLVQVAVNDLLMLGLFVPICGGLIGASQIALPWGTIILAVVLFIVAPLVLASSVRYLVVSRHGEAFLKDRIVAPFKPVTMFALLATLVLIFIFQGQKIKANPVHILLLAVPIIIQSCLVWLVSYFAGWYVCIPHSRNAPASLIATSNFFELAVAVAISIYGLDSGAALATVVGVLVEVPLMLVFCQVCMLLEPALTRRCSNCDTVCPTLPKLGESLLQNMCCGQSRREQTHRVSQSELTWGPQYEKNVMFLCNHNSCRSQMADGWLQHLRGSDSVGVASAGIVGGTAVKEGAIVVMREAGVDISAFTSDAMAEFRPEDFDVVISCCGCGSKLDGEKAAWKARTVFEDWNLDDPPAIDPGDLSAYRRVRDEAKAKVVELLDSLRTGLHGDPSFVEEAKAIVASTGCVVFSKSTCPHCASAKQLLGAEYGANFRVVEADKDMSWRCRLGLQEYFGAATGAGTWPRVFVGGVCVGGLAELQRLHDDGRLRPLLAQAGALQ